MTSTGVRKSARTPIKRPFSEEFEELSNSDDEKSAGLSSDEEWEPANFEEKQELIVPPHGVADEEFDGPTEDPLAFDYDRTSDNPVAKHGASSNTIHNNSTQQLATTEQDARNLQLTKEHSEGENKKQSNNGRRETEAQKQRRLELQRLRRQQMTEEQRKRHADRRRLRRKNMTEEQRRRRAEQQRINRRKRTDEQRQREYEKKNLRKKKKTDEMNKTQNELKKQLEEQLTEVERKEITDKLQEIEEAIFQRTMKGYLTRHAWLATMSQEELKKERRRATVRHYAKIVKETPEERQERLTKSRERYRNQRKNWTPEQHERHREWIRNFQKMNAQLKPYSEFPEEKKERIRAYQRERLKQETPEHREQRLARYKRNMEKRRLLNKMQEEGMSKEAAEAELRIFRADLYPEPKNHIPIGGSKPFKPYRPRDPDKQKPPPGRKSNVTADELAELELREDRRRKRRPRPCKTQENSTATVTLGLPCEKNSISTASKPVHCSSSAAIDTVEKQSSPSYASTPLVSDKQVTAFAKEDHEEASLNKCSAEDNSNLTEKQVEKDLKVDQSDLVETFESMEDNASPLGSPLGVEYSDSENGNDADSVDVKVDCPVECDGVQTAKNASTSSNTVGNDKRNNEDVIDSSTTQEESSQNEIVKLHYHCDKCGKIYTYKNGFKRHLEAHENSKSFKCPHPSCDKEFSHSSYVLRHFLKTHGDKKVVPQEPKIDTEERFRVKKQQPNSSIFPCQYCSKKFDCDSQLVRHVHSVHEYNGNKDGFMCEHCCKVFKVKCTLNDHIRRIHLGMDHKCDICARSFQSPMKLWKHKVDGHGMKDLDPSSFSSKIKVVQCEYCGVRLFRGMKLHIEKEHPDRFEEYVNAGNLIRDRREEKRQWWHTIGKFKKKKEWSLARGKQAKSNQVKSTVKIPCTICSQTFTRPDSWRKHMEKIHPSNNAVSCDKCKLVRATETDLVKHILNRHPGLAKIKIHGIVADPNSDEDNEKDKKEKRILCQFCRSPYDDRFLYRMHLYEKHCKDIIQSFKEGIAEEQDKPEFPCPHCDITIRTSETGLIFHIRKAHPDHYFAKIKSKRKEEGTTLYSQKKRVRRKEKFSGTTESSDDDGNGSNEDPHNNSTIANPSRRSSRTKCPPRRYIDDKQSDLEETVENVPNRESRQQRRTKPKKVVVPSSPTNLTQAEKNLLKKCSSVIWKGTPVVVLERLILVKTEVL